MSPRNDVVVMLAAALAPVLLPAEAQTIGDYSRVQRLMLENTMSQAAARSAGMAASAPVVGASAAAAPMPWSNVPRAAAIAMPSLAEGVQVSGMFASGATSVAEVVVNATSYLLQAGQEVPGTSWRVESVGVERVVLSRRDGAGTADAGSVRRVFALPALR